GGDLGPQRPILGPIEAHMAYRSIFCTLSRFNIALYDVTLHSPIDQYVDCRSIGPPRVRV
ncbi:hypothetical protein, partial [Corynebacterium sp. HMSC11H10]|uniref:hypothetical protein n=1 Tax=Corynebacterium sp. HMSC11H10 TaxID=1581090 RepID=UPI001AEFA46C